jgi:hypothetical protein
MRPYFLSVNRECAVCGHGAVVHRRDFCSMPSCLCLSFEELKYTSALGMDLTRRVKRSTQVHSRELQKDTS